jgi:hypothetical protein
LPFEPDPLLNRPDICPTRCTCLDFHPAGSVGQIGGIAGNFRRQKELQEFDNSGLTSNLKLSIVPPFNPNESSAITSHRCSHKPSDASRIPFQLD